MSFEAASQQFESFSEAELTSLIDKSQAFAWHRRPAPRAPDPASPAASVYYPISRSTIPHFSQGERTLIVFPGSVEPETCISLSERLSSPGSKIYASIGRQVMLNPERFSEPDYRNQLPVFYTEIGLHADGTTVRPLRGLEPDSNPMMMYRPFTHDDMRDMTEMLDGGLVAPGSA